jgi:hypothetical protein
MRARLLFALCLSISGFALFAGELQGTAEASGKTIRSQPLSLKLLPGETGSTTVVVNPHPQNEHVVSWITLDGFNSADSPDASSSCGGTVTGYGALGQQLWSWTSKQYYDYYGHVVYIGNHYGTPRTYYLGWAYDHDQYDDGGSGTWQAQVWSTGYFNWLGGVERSYGEVQYTIQGNGVCYVNGTSGDW